MGEKQSLETAENFVKVKKLVLKPYMLFSQAIVTCSYLYLVNGNWKKNSSYTIKSAC